MSFEIITDSSANLPDSIIEKYNLHILSLSFHVDDNEFLSYEKGKTSDIKKFYTMMREKKIITTSLINPEVCYNLFDNLLNEDKDILYIGFSSALSGTFQTGNLAIEELKEKYPNRKMYALDTLAASLGEGLLVIYAAMLRDEGKNISEVYNWLLDNRLKLCHWFTVDDLLFLRRGGRISASSAIIGTALSVKPIMHMNNEGKLIPVGKVRGRKTSLNQLVINMEQRIIEPQNQIICITHGDCIEDAKYVEKKVREKFAVKDVIINYVDPVIGAHSGPGTIALFFLGNHR